MTFMTDGSVTVIIPRPSAVISLSFIVLVETLPRKYALYTIIEKQMVQETGGGLLICRCSLSLCIGIGR